MRSSLLLCVLAIAVVSGALTTDLRPHGNIVERDPTGIYYTYNGSATVNNLDSASSNEVANWGSTATLYYGAIVTGYSYISSYSFYIRGYEPVDAWYPSDTFEGRIYETDGSSAGNLVWSGAFSLSNNVGSSPATKTVEGKFYRKVSAKVGGAGINLTPTKFYWLSFFATSSQAEYQYLLSNGAGSQLWYINDGYFPSMTLYDYYYGVTLAFEIESSSVPTPAPDVNECLAANACPNGFRCVNTYGSFLCVDNNAGLFCQCPGTPTPTSPPATVSPTSPPATVSPTSPPATVSPTSPPATVAPTSAPAGYYIITDSTRTNAISLGVGSHAYLRTLPYNANDQTQHWSLVSASSVGLGPGYFFVNRANPTLNWDINAAFQVGARLQSWERKATQAATGGQRFAVDVTTGTITPAGNVNFKVGFSGTQVQLVASSSPTQTVFILV